MSDSKEVLSLTGLRAVLAWWVVAFHFFRKLATAQNEWLGAVVSGGHVAVDVFFVLSGYVLMRGYGGIAFDRTARRSFYLRRLARIYPVYVVSLAIGVGARGQRLADDFASGIGIVRLGLELPLLNAWTHLAMFHYNFAAWSLSVEAFFYLLCPWVLPAIARANRRETVVLLGCAWIATFVAPSLYTLLDPDHLGRASALGDEVKWIWYLKFFPLQRLPEFTAGAAAARLEFRPRWGATIAALSLICILMSRQLPYAFLQAGVLLPIIVLLVAGVAANSSGPLASPAMVALGRASYATYILHWPLFLAWSRFDPDLWDRSTHLAAFSACLAAVSLLTHFSIEEPARRRLNAYAGQLG